MSKSYEITYMGFPGLPLAVQLTDFLSRVDASAPMTPRARADFKKLKVEEIIQWVQAAKDCWERANNPKLNPCLRLANITGLLQCFTKVGLKVTNPRHCDLIDKFVTPEKIHELRSSLKEKSGEYIRDFTVEHGLDRIGYARPTVSAGSPVP